MAVDRQAPDLERVALQSETLYAVIGVVASAPDLDRVLDGIVDLLSEATDCHACFVYLRDGERLRLRAASRIYAHLVGRVEHGARRGPRRAGSRATARPEFIRDHALADPRMKYVPGDRGGALPVDGRGADPGAVGPGARHGRPAHRRAARVRRGRADVSRPHRLARRRSDRERAPVRGHPPPRRGAHAPVEPLAGDRRGRRARGALPRGDRGRARACCGCDACQLYLLDRGTGRLELAGRRPAGRASPWRRPEGTAVLLDLLPPPRPRQPAARRSWPRSPPATSTSARSRRRGRVRPSARRPTSSCARSPTSSRSRSTRPSSSSA